MIVQPNMFDPNQVVALTVRQPWALLIVNGTKTIENRTWATSYRGPLYIHAGNKLHDVPRETIQRRYRIRIDPDHMQFGGIIGVVDLIDIVRRSSSPWFEGPFGWVLRNPRPISFVRMPGQQGLFQVELSKVLASAKGKSGPQY